MEQRCVVRQWFIPLKNKFIEYFSIFYLTIEAKNSTKPWNFNMQVYWQGKAIDRRSQEYQDLFDEAYNALYTNADFRKALDSTKGHKLIHSIGHRDRMKILLTEEEFIGRLTRLRDTGHSKEIKFESGELF